MSTGLGEGRQLQRELGLFEVFCLASGAMISSGLFVLPGLAFSKAGPAVIFSYLLAGLLCLPGMLSIAEMATAMPRAGADCYGIMRSMGPGTGTVASLLSWFSLSMKSAFALVGISVFAEILSGLDRHIPAVVLAAFFLGLNTIGVREAARAQVALVVGLFTLMFFYIILGLPEVSVTRFEPFMPYGHLGLFSMAGYVFVSYAGLLQIASVAEEVRNPGRTIPLGMVVSLVVVCVVYTLMVFVTVGVLDAEVLAGSLKPISDGASAFMGSVGGVAMGIAAALAFLTTANAGMMTAARALVSPSRDALLPPAFGRLNRRFGTPVNALVFTACVVVAAQFLKLELLVEAASVVLIMTNVLSCIAVIVLRESRVQNYRPVFRAPGYPWLQLVGLVGLGFVVFEMGLEAYAVSALLALAGFVAYWLYGRRRAQQDFALLHLIERITARELVTGSLERELREIIRERDDMVIDRFDGLIEACPVIDLKKSDTLEVLFDKAALELSDRVGIPAAELLEALNRREQESSTVLLPGVAVPHIVIRGSGTFAVLMARSAAGMSFPGTTEPVHAVFILMGSRDERNFHLQVLSALAQVISQADFMTRWRQARGADGLRDVLLLSERRRQADS